MQNDYTVLASIITQLTCENDRKDQINSPFDSISLLRPSTKGAISKKLLSEFLTRKGCTIQPSDNRGYDRMVNQYKCAIKFSTLWNDGKYVFQQIKDTNWDYILCLGLSPHKAHFWYARRDIFTFLAGQHTGSKAQDTKWISIMPDGINPYQNYLFGGELSEGIRLFMNELQKP